MAGVVDTEHVSEFKALIKDAVRLRNRLAQAEQSVSEIPMCCGPEVSGNSV